MTDTSDRRERYATAIHDAMETGLSLVDQEPACQALIARAADAAGILPPPSTDPDWKNTAWAAANADDPAAGEAR